MDMCRYYLWLECASAVLEHLHLPASQADASFVAGSDAVLSSVGGSAMFGGGVVSDAGSL
jgi:hypothetical protein